MVASDSGYCGVAGKVGEKWKSRPQNGHSTDSILAFVTGLTTEGKDIKGLLDDRNGIMGFKQEVNTYRYKTSNRCHTKQLYAMCDL
jgi:hypothetical protein